MIPRKIYETFSIIASDGIIIQTTCTLKSMQPGNVLRVFKNGTHVLGLHVS